MSIRNRWFTRILACAVAIALVSSFALISKAGCAGTMYLYYETAACLNETGVKLVCPDGIQYDPGPNGTFQQTPYVVVESIDCPCGGGQPDGDDLDM